MKSSKQKFPWLAVLVLGLAYGSAYNPPYIRYFLYDPMIKAMGCTNVQLSFLTTVCILASAITAIPGGWAADKWSTKNIMIISLLANVPFIIFSSIFIKCYTLHVISWAVMGTATGFAFWPAVLKAVRIVGGEDQQTRSYGVFEASQGLLASFGNMIALALFSRFINNIFGFQVALFSMAIYEVFAVIAVYFFYDEASEKRLSLKDQSIEKKNEFRIMDTIELIKNPGVWLASMTLASVYCLYISQSYLTPYFTGVLGAALTITGFFAIMRDYGMKVIGGPLGGLIGDRIGSPALLNASCLIVSALLLFIISKLKPGSANVLSLATLFVLLNALVCCMAKGTMWAVLDEAHIPLRLAGTAIGFSSLICIYAVDSIMPLVNGWLLDKYANNLALAYHYYFNILIVFTMVGAISGLIIFFKERKK